MILLIHKVPYRNWYTIVVQKGTLFLRQVITKYEKINELRKNVKLVGTPSKKGTEPNLCFEK